MDDLRAGDDSSDSVVIPVVFGAEASRSGDTHSSGVEPNSIAPVEDAGFEGLVIELPARQRRFVEKAAWALADDVHDRHPLGDLLLMGHQLLTCRAVTVRPVRANISNDRLNHLIAHDAVAVGSRQVRRLSCLDISADRFAIHTGMLGDPAQPRSGSPAVPSYSCNTSLISFTLISRQAMFTDLRDGLRAVTDTERANDETTGTARRWSHNWQSRWSHHPGKNQVTLVPCSGQTTQRSTYIHTNAH